MSAAKYDLYIDQGETFVRQVKLTQPVFNTNGTLKYGTDGQPDRTGAAVILTGYTAKAQLKPAYNSPITDTISMTAVVSDSANGKIQISLTAAQTKLLALSEYFYDLEIISGDTVKRVLEGKAYISPGVSL